MTITLRQREKNKKISMYLDIYDNGIRQYEYLRLYLHVNKGRGSLSHDKKEQNKRTIALAESIKVKRTFELQSKSYDIADYKQQNIYLLAYIENYISKNVIGREMHDNWSSTLVHLKRYLKKDIRIRQVDSKFIEGFKRYLSHTQKNNSIEKLSINTQIAYYKKFKSIILHACNAGVIQVNPMSNITTLRGIETEREILTLSELKKLHACSTEENLIKQSFVFMCLTGLRFSDCVNLKTENIQQSDPGVTIIRFRQKKTGSNETMPISKQAAEIIESLSEGKQQVFPSLKYTSWTNKKLQEIVNSIGIEKKITFHCARHTYATLQLSLGTDIYTVSKMLGHKDIKTTQVYSKIFDTKKVEASNKIEL